MNPKFLNLIKRISKDIFLEIALAEKLKISRGEETITDNILLELAKSPFYDITTNQIRKKEESKIGADWEWLVGNKELGYLRVAIQAKKLNPKKGTYNSLKYRVNSTPKNTYQHEILEKYSRSNGALPMYSFYNFTEIIKEKTHWHCKKPKFKKELLGWSITPLNVVKKCIKTRGQRTFEAIHSNSETIPMVCFFKEIGDYLSSNKKNNGKMKVNYFNNFDLNHPITIMENLPEIFLNNERSPCIIDENELPSDYINKDIGLIPKTISIFEIK
jgi:hypothetical protein